MAQTLDLKQMQSRAVSAGFERSIQTIRAVREQGWTYPSNYLDIYFDKIGVHENVSWAEVGEHCLSSDGGMAWPAFGVFVDVGLSNAARASLGQKASLATVSLQLSVKRLPRAGKLQAIGRIKNTMDTAQIGAVVTEVDVWQGGELLAAGRALMGLAPFKNALDVQSLPHAAQHFHPWADCVPEPGSADYLTYEAACRAEALESSASFIDKFWAAHKLHGNSDLSSYRFCKGEHLANRAGNVHGGILYGLAANAARGVAPPGWLIADSSVQYLNAATDAYFDTHTEILRQGANTMVVSCHVISSQNKLVIHSQWTLLKPKVN